MTAPSVSIGAHGLRWSLTAAQRSRIRVISFDLDDTLWDCDPVIVQAEQTLFEAMKERTPRITQALSLADLREKRIEFARSHPEYRVDVTYLRTASLRDVLSEYAYPATLAEELFQIFYQARSQVVLYDDALDVLQSLATKFELAALTNGNADLSIIGIDSHFADIQHASLNNPPKPDRTMFDRAAARLGVTTSQILHIGDNPTTDVDGARNAGAHAVWFNQHGLEWPAELAEPHGEIAKLSDLVTLLDTDQG
ncbi:MAG: HAD-IA family hydrolase [Gammaproteobacteria bacterium]|nr:HAD-IA family hydrolase [Gammaproteobacteria bacterium]